MAVKGIEIAVGQKWKCRDGKVREIVGKDEGMAYPWFLDDNRTVGEAGFEFCHDTNAPGDLIELVSEPASAELEFVAPESDNREYSGGSVDYYKIQVEQPTSGGAKYTAECNDIIEALGMNYAEGNAFKAIWRKCAAQRGLSKRGYTDGVYDAEKVAFFAERMIQQELQKRGGAK